MKIYNYGKDMGQEIKAFDRDMPHIGKRANGMRPGRKRD